MAGIRRRALRQAPSRLMPHGRRRQLLAPLVSSVRHLFFFSSRRRHTRFDCDWSSDVCSSDLVFDAVPPVLKEAAYGIGCTTWEVVRYVVLPYTRVGVIGGVMLGLGRALGETMAEIGRASCRGRV